MTNEAATKAQILAPLVRDALYETRRIRDLLIATAEWFKTAPIESDEYLPPETARYVREQVESQCAEKIEVLTEWEDILLKMQVDFKAGDEVKLCAMGKFHQDWQEEERSIVRLGLQEFHPYLDLPAVTTVARGGTPIPNLLPPRL